MDSTILASIIGVSGVILGAIIASVVTILANALQNRAENKRLDITLRAQEKREESQRHFDAKKDAYIAAITLFVKNSNERSFAFLEQRESNPVGDKDRILAEVMLVAPNEIKATCVRLFSIFATSVRADTAPTHGAETTLVAEIARLMREDLHL